MKKSSISILLLMLVIIFTISAVSAADTNDSSDSAVQAIDETSIDEEVDSQAVDNVLTANDNADVMAAGEGNFTELQSLVDSGTVLMDKNYVRVDGENDILIDTGVVTIVGNNHVIDANNLGGIFKIGSGASLTLTGVILKNGNAENGGAINNNGTVAVINSKLLDNTAVCCGGAIYNNGGSLTLTGTTLDGNSISDETQFMNGGAAIYSEGGSTLIATSVITNNMKDITHSGGSRDYAGSRILAAVSCFSATKLTVTDSRFENNSGQIGGALFVDYTPMIVSGSTFIDNFALFGGAICINLNEATITNSTFKGNKARGTGPIIEACANGGAIFSDSDKLIVSGCVFEDNSASIGGAISANNTRISNCNFTDNVASAEYSETYNGQPNTYGGFGDAIFNNGTSVISNSNFENNGVWVKDSNIEDSSFVDSIIEVNSGSLIIKGNTYNNNAEFDITGTNTSDVFLNCSGQIPKIIEADIYLVAETFTELQNFINSGSTAVIHLTSDINKVVAERDIFADGILIEGPVTIDGCGFAIASNYGKIFTVAEDGILTIVNTTITATGEGIIVNNGTIMLDVTNPNTYTHVNYVIENNGFVIQDNMNNFTQLDNLIALVDGGQVGIGSSKIRKEGNEFTIYENGIVIDNKDYLSIIGECASIDASGDGAIFNLTSSTLNLENISLTGARSIPTGPKSAIYVDEDSYLDLSYVNVTDCDIVIYSNGVAIIEDSIFYDNNAQFGAVIVNENGELVVRDSNFTENNAAIATSGTTSIYSSYFAGNGQSQAIGGAIYSDGSSSNNFTLTIMDSIFDSNRATEYGGAIYITDSDLYIRNCNFTNQYAGTCGAIYIGAGVEATIADSNFINNLADNGAAIAFILYDCDSTIDNCIFKENEARMGTIAIVTDEPATVSVKNSKFENNVGDGSAILNGGVLELSNNTITNDQGKYAEIVNDGAITSYLKAVVLQNTTVIVSDANVTLTATLVDDMGNLINDISFNFIVDGVYVPAVYNETTNVYEANYTLPHLGYFTVSMIANNPNMDIYTGILSYTKGTFTDLYARIMNGVEIGFVDLPYDFKYDAYVDGDKFPNGIQINSDNNMYIRGNGHTICGDDVTRIFSIEGTLFLTLDNVTLCHGNAEYGGAVFVANNTKFTALNSKFIDNAADHQGGAIYSEGNVTISNSLFDSNDISSCKAEDDGGAAIYNNQGALTIKSSNFTNNLKDIVIRKGDTGDWVQAAVTTFGDTSVTDCYFANNTGCWGGAINSIESTKLIIKNTLFEGNNATFGGAIYIHTSEYSEINNCTFVNNRALGYTKDLNNKGGAIYVYPGTELKIIDSDFFYNSAFDGGAILSELSEVSIEECTFMGNRADNGGGAIYNNYGNTLNISYSGFSANDALSGNAIFNDGELYLADNTINEAEADIVDGIRGVILSEINIVVLDNGTRTMVGECTLTANITDDMGNLIDDSRFKFVVNGTELNATFDPVEGLYKADYVNDIAGYYYVTMIYVNNENLNIKTGTLINIRGTFTDLFNKLGEGITDLPYDFTYVEEIDEDVFVDGILIYKATNINGNGHTIDAKNANRIFNVTSTLVLENITLANGFADEGAAIYSNTTLIAENVKFINNTAVSHGGAIYSTGFAIITNSVFDGNDISGRSVGEIYGGAAIYNEGNLYLDTVTVTNNLKGTAFDNETDASVSAAIVTSGTTQIENSYFANNTGYQGGAILSVLNNDIVTIKNTVFECNNATAGGAISVIMSRIEVDNCSFKDNLANAGGAILAAMGQVTIKDSKFIANEADVGGAIFIMGLLTDSRISNCEFKLNIADDAGAVYIGNTQGNTLTIENSVLTNNFAVDQGNAIINNGTLYLSNNTINKDHADILVDEGNITSPVVVVFLGNQTIPANMGDTVVLNATFVDDMGNAIYDSKFRFTVNDEGIEDISYDEENALYTVEYYIATAGSKIISTNCSYQAIEKFVGILDIPKANVTLTIFAEDIIEGENATVVVNVYGVKGTLLNTTVKVLVNNTLYPVEVIDSVGTLPVSGLEPESYAIFVMFEEDDNYNTAYNSSTFYVKYLTQLYVIVAPEHNYGQEVTIGFGLFDSKFNPVTGVLNVTINNESYNVLADKGVGYLYLNDLASGEYTVTSIFEGNTVLNGTTGNKATFIVKKETVFNVTINGTYPEATIRIEGENGVYNVALDNGQSVNVTVKFGLGTETIALPAGDYVATVTYVSDNEFSKTSKVVPFTVEKANPQLDATISDYIEVNEEGVQIEITLAEDATGYVTVNFDNQALTIGGLAANGTLTINVPSGRLTAGTHSFTVKYTGDNNYTSDEVSKSFEVSKITPTINITVEEDEIGVMGGPYVNVTVASDATGLLIINFNDERTIYDYILEGNYSFQVYDLQAGDYFISVNYGGDDKYYAAFGYYYFEVPQANATPIISDVTSDILGGQNVTFVVAMNNSFATGNLTIFVDGFEVQTVELDEDANANIVIPGLGNGTHIIGVKYDGDDNFLESEIVNTTVTVTKANSTVALDLEVNSTYYPFMTVIYTVENETALTFTVVDQDGLPYEGEIIIDGLYVLTDLPVGNYTITVTNAETDQFNGASASATFAILRSTPIISDVTEDILGGQNATFVVEIDNKEATGNLTIYVDGAIAQIVELKDAKANIAIPDLGNGTHIIGVKYNGNLAFYESDIVNTTVNVTKANSSVVILLDVNETFDDYMVIDYIVENETQLIITVVDQDGKVFVGEFVDDVYILSALPVGNYTVNITNVENKMFHESSANATFAIIKFDFNVDFPVNTSSTEISITTPKDATGLLLVDINGDQFYAFVENGTASVTIPKLAPGEYTATVTYTGDDLYGSQTLTKHISIPSNLPENAVTIPEYCESYSPTYSISLPEDATGYFSVVADGKEYVEPLKDGKASITIPHLAEGEHRILVSYTGDDKYSSFYKETMLNIHIPVYKLALNKDIKSLYSAKKYYKVLVTKDGKLMVGQTVTFKFNGKTYKVKTDKNGIATLKVPTNVKVKTYDITASFKDVKVSNKVKVKNIIKIKNVAAKKSKKVIKIKAVLKKVDGKYLKGKKLKLKVKGMTFKAKTNKKGVAVFKLKKKAINKLAKTKSYTYSVTKNMKVTVKKPKYTYYVYYGKDVAKKKITVK